jgi:hypothetical protein
VLNGDYHPEGATLEQAMAVVDASRFSERLGAEACALPLGDLGAPIARLLRDGGWIMRHEVIMALAEMEWWRTTNATRSDFSTRERTVGTPAGLLRLGVVVTSGRLSARLDLAPGIRHVSNRISLRGDILPDTLLAACEGRRVRDVMEVEALDELSDATILQASRTERAATLRLTLRPDGVGLGQIRDR